MKHKSKLILIIALSCALILCAGATSLAVYLGQANQKGVVTTQRMEAHFSSNVLKQYSQGSIPSARVGRSAPVNLFGVEDASLRSTYFTVANYTQNNPGLYHSDDIYYTLTIEVVSRTEAPVDSAWLPSVDYAGNVTPLATDTHTITGLVLPGMRSSEHRFGLLYTQASLDHIAVRVTATPDEVSSPSLSRALLYRELIPVATDSSAVPEFSCVGTFVDAATHPDLPSTDYVAFNYHIAVQNGVGKASLVWDPTYLTIDPVFLARMQALPTTEYEDGRLQFAIDGYTTDYYDLQFYRTTQPIEGESWATLNSLVTLISTQE